MEIEKNPIGKLFKFDKSALHFSGEPTLCTEKIYLCIDVRSKMVALSSFGHSADEQELATFIEFDKNTLKVIESPTYVVTTNWWHTEVNLFKSMVVGEVDIQHIIQYNLKELNL